MPRFSNEMTRQSIYPYFISVSPGITEEDSAICVEVGKSVEDMGQVLNGQVKNVVVPGVDGPRHEIGADDKGAGVVLSVVHEDGLRVVCVRNLNKCVHEMSSFWGNEG